VTQLLDTVASRAGWGTVAPRGRYRGIAFATLIAHVVEVSVPAPGVIKIHRVVCAAEPGTVLDPGISTNSIEGGVAWGLSCAFNSAVTFSSGRTVQSNFHDYEVLRIPQMPPVKTHWINSGARPLGGVGEVGPVTLIPALTNAIFAATGTRYRSLPLSRHDIRLA